MNCWLAAMACRGQHDDHRPPLIGPSLLLLLLEPEEKAEAHQAHQDLSSVECSTRRLRREGAEDEDEEARGSTVGR